MGLRARLVTAAAALLLIAGFVVAVRPRLEQVDAGREDIFHVYQAGRRLAHGENPYARIVGGDMRVNQKYATYLPAFYLLTAATVRLGADDFNTWLPGWRRALLLLHLAVGALLALLVADRRRAFSGLLALAFWLLNRWSLYVLAVAQIDDAALLPLLGSLALFAHPRRRRASLLLLGVSLAIKQLGGLLVPLYLVWIFQSAPRGERLRDSVKGLALIGVVPFLVSLPFLLWNADGFIRSIAFSVTRLPDVSDGALSLDGVLGMEGVRARLAMLGMLAAVYGTAAVLAQRRRGVAPLRYSSSLWAQLIFLGYNPVLFPQYFVWLVALLPPATMEWLAAGGAATAISAPEPSAATGD